MVHKLNQDSRKQVTKMIHLFKLGYLTLLSHFGIMDLIYSFQIINMGDLTS